MGHSKRTHRFDKRNIFLATLANLHSICTCFSPVSVPRYTISTAGSRATLEKHDRFAKMDTLRAKQTLAKVSSRQVRRKLKRAALEVGTCGKTTTRLASFSAFLFNLWRRPIKILSALCFPRDHRVNAKVQPIVVIRGMIN